MSYLESFANWCAALGSRSRDRWVPLVLLALVAFSATALYQRIEAPENDSRVYTGLAINLMAGRGYQFDFEPHTMYPPGLPLLYAAVGREFGLGYPVRILLNGICAFLGLVAAYFVLRRRAGSGVALGITLLMGCSSYFFARVTAAPMSDVPFFAFGSVCLYLVDALWFDAPQLGKRILMVMAAAIFVPLTVSTRSVGVAILPAIFCFVVSRLFRGKTWTWKGALSLAIPAATGFAALMLWSHWAAVHKPVLLDGEFSYQYKVHLLMKDFHNALAGQATPADLAARTVANCGCAGASFTQMVTSAGGWFAPKLWSPLTLIPIVLFGIGLLRSLWQTGGGSSDWYVIFSLAILLPWWFCDDAPRFLLPICPYLALLVFLGLSAVASMIRKNAARFAQLAALFCGGIGLLSIADFALGGDAPSKQAMVSLGLWLAAAFAAGVAGYWLSRHASFAHIPSFWRPVCISLFALFLVANFTARVASAVRALHPDVHGMHHYPSLLAGAWIVDHTQPDAVIMAQQDAILHSLTSRRVVQVPVTIDPSLVESIIQKRHVSYLVVEDREGFREPDSRAVFGVLQHLSNERLDLVDKGYEYSIYRISAQ